MRKRAQKAFILAVGVTIVLSAGCQEEEISGTRKTRLIASENIRLSKEIEKRDEKIQKLEKLHAEQIERQEELLTECLAQKETLEGKLQQNLRELVDSVLAVVMEKNVELRGENESLRAQIEQLKTKLAEGEGDQEDTEDKKAKASDVTIPVIIR